MEKIVKIGGEGGSVTLVGVKVGDGWRYRVTTDESALADDEFGPEDLVRDSRWVSDLEQALELMDRYPWASLYPLHVHPEFGDLVLQAVEQRARSPREVRRWRERIGARAPLKA